MRHSHIEEYVSAIYRLREDAETPLPLARLTAYFDFSPVSVHEMIQKLEQEQWVAYYPYRGVTLTPAGEAEALAVLRRHRLWERFLTDMLEIPWAEAHTIAGDLEHAAPESVTERLSLLLGDPAACPHGAPIPPRQAVELAQCLCSVPEEASVRVEHFAPETAELLSEMQRLGIQPGQTLCVRAQSPTETHISYAGSEIVIPEHQARAIWVTVH